VGWRRRRIVVRPSRQLSILRLYRLARDEGRHSSARAVMYIQSGATRV